MILTQIEWWRNLLPCRLELIQSALAQTSKRSSLSWTSTGPLNFQQHVCSQLTQWAWFFLVVYIGPARACSAYRKSLTEILRESEVIFGVCNNSWL
jgi:hypothetical protein